MRGSEINPRSSALSALNLLILSAKFIYKWSNENFISTDH
jgi:hypothetical protein